MNTYDEKNDPLVTIPALLTSRKATIQDVMNEIERTKFGSPETFDPDSADTCFYLSEMKHRIEKVVELGIPVTKKIMELHGVIITPQFEWEAVRDARRRVYG